MVLGGPLESVLAVALSPDAVGGGAAAAGVAVVHDVVVEQGRGLEELHRGGGLEGGLVGTAPGGHVAPGEEPRPEALAALHEGLDGLRQLVGGGVDGGEVGTVVGDLGGDARADRGLEGVSEGV